MYDPESQQNDGLVLQYRAHTRTYCCYLAVGGVPLNKGNSSLSKIECYQ